MLRLLIVERRAEGAMRQGYSLFNNPSTHDG